MNGFLFLLVVDLEATCDNRTEAEPSLVPKHAMETIEIGAVLADGSSMQPIDEPRTAPDADSLLHAPHDHRAVGRRRRPSLSRSGRRPSPSRGEANAALAPEAYVPPWHRRRSKHRAHRSGARVADGGGRATKRSR